MFNFARTTIVLASAIAAFATLAAPAVAAPVNETVSIPISYADLNLASPEGAASLERRIRRAVTNICGSAADGLSRRAAMVRCRKDALRDAKGQFTQVIAQAARGDQHVVLAAR